MGSRKISKLEEKCLAVVTKNFKWYYLASKLPNSSTLADHLELLAILYSEILIERLKSIFFKRPQYLDFFINRHLRKLDLVGACGYDPSFPQTLIDKLQTFGGSILSLVAVSDTFKESFYESLMSALPNVVHILILDNVDISVSNLLIRFLESIGRNCPSLKVLKFHHYLEQAVANEYHDSISFIIKHCPRLEVLEFYDTVGALYNLHKGDLDLVKGKTDLKQCAKYVLKRLSSSRRNYPIGDALEICSVLCPHVSSLSIKKVECDQDLEKISCFTLLEDVTLGGLDTVSPNCLNQFLMLRGSALVYLDLYRASCLSIFTLIESCPKLRQLILKKVVGHSCSSSKERYNTSLRDLRVLSFWECNFTEEGVAEALKSIFSGDTKLEELCLHLHGCSGLTDRIFSSLGLHKLPRLIVSCSDIEMDPLRKLMLCGSLQYLSVSGCPNVRLPDLTANIPSDRIPHNL